MFVKEVVLDGFKSYRVKTKVGEFDPHFNAITGLNGSGKSNILDAICFVLGITSMNVVRCKSLADCIYVGQGDKLHKASVSIVLDNKDKKKSPPGQRHYDEIIVSRTVQRNGECRYYINKTGATKKAVTDLFESVQLNVNNPNFMIMQGKITKVVNMKPKEILHMIEETVGATLYQAKREKAEIELKNKQFTIDSINSVLMDHIKPTLDKQSKAHDMIQEYNCQMREKNEMHIEWSKLHYFDLKKQGSNAETKLNAILEQDEKDDDLKAKYRQEIKQLKVREEQMNKESAAKFTAKVDKAEKALAEEKKKLHAKQTDVKTAKESLDKANKAVKDAEKAKKTEEKNVEDFKKKSANALTEFDQLQQEKNKATEELEKAREQENQLRSGKILDDEGKSVDIDQELNRISTEITAIKPEVQDGRQKISEYKNSLTQLDRQIKQTPSDDQVERDYAEKMKKFEDIKREASKRNINADENVADLRKSQVNAERERDGLLRQRNSILNRNYNLSFNYNKERVGVEGIRGCVYDHIKMNGVEEWGNALESALGGFVGQIIVDTDTVGKNLVKFGQMRRRVHVHPLNTFRSSYRPSNVSQRTLDQRFGPGNAIFALDLLEYGQDIQPVVEHFMGNKVLCKNMDIARKVAFDMRLNAYTVAGDTVDPGGIMKGGSRNDIGVIIKDCVELGRINEVLQQLNAQIQDLTRKVDTAKSNEGIIEGIERAKRDLHNADQMRKLTKFSQLKDEFDTMKTKLQEEGAQLQELECRLKNFEKERAQLQKKADQVESLREKNLRDNANLIKKWEKALETATKKYEARQKDFSEIEMDLKSKAAFIDGYQKDIDDAIAFVKECEEKLAQAEEELRKFKTHYEVIEQAFVAADAERSEWFEEAKQIQDQIKKLDERKEAAEINKMKRNNIRKQCQDSVDYCASAIEELKDRFKDLNFDVETRPTSGKSAAVVKKELDIITKKLDDMHQRLDHEAAAALQSTQKDFTSSTEKLSMIEKNKRNLIKAIKTLDDAKKQKVQTAYDDVNQKFDSMMSTLLPEARAKLVEVVPGDLTQGVNIHVQLGGVWKESLTELSGGQRSLVALSLVLSLCMYNPAPFYILDEVDAALDLSHTQNIGVVIQNQFKGTQFICVSLKDGMFSNANVLFTAKHEGGSSVVHRVSKKNLQMPPPSHDVKRARNR
ncbi:unnamed protein product [Orchesella dallaii]|uniref:Structural maintenance of chromosomes protein n=1 Tax=Orchesella dallaii TaxID=48710 RepID=A0ABP1RCS2_9HEXA